MLIERPSTTDVRRESLKEWSLGQFKKYGLFPDKVPCLVYWESVATKKELADGVPTSEWGRLQRTHNVYDYLHGEHYYLKDRILSCSYNGATDELKELIGEKFMLFEVRRGSKRANRVYVRKIDDGAILFQTMSFRNIKPFKNEYGMLDTFCYEDTFIVTNQKDIIKVHPSESPEYMSRAYANVIFNQNVKQDGWMIPDLGNFADNNEQDGAFGYSYKKMMLDALGGSIDRVYVTSSTYVIDVTSPYGLKEFMGFKELQLTKSKRQKYLDKVSYDLPEINKDDFDLISDGDENTYYFGFTQYINAYITRTESDEVVVRYFYKNDDYSKEVFRLYINQDGFIGSKVTFYNEWVAVNASKHSSNWKAKNFFIQKDIFDTPMKNIIYYTRDFFEAKKTNMVGETIYSLLRYPILESAIKIGIDLESYYRSTYNLFETLCARVGAVNLKEKNINKALGLNSYQVQYLVDNPRSAMIRGLKNIFKTGETNMWRDYDGFISIADMDNDTFDKYINIITELSDMDANKDNGSGHYRYGNDEPSSNIIHLLKRIQDIYGKDTVLSDGVINFIKGLLEKHAELLKERREDSRRYAWLNFSEQPLNIYGDYLNMAEVINDRNMAPAKLSSFEELMDAHDSLMYIANEKQHEYEQQQFDILKDEWAKLTETGEEYSIIYPDSPASIITEGRALSHCVASFVKSVSKGSTTILFLRRNSEIKKPLLTIEVRDGKVRQAHGFANCSLASMEAENPGINKFFHDWAKKKKLVDTNINSMLCAGY